MRFEGVNSVRDAKAPVGDRRNTDSKAPRRELTDTGRRT